MSANEKINIGLIGIGRKGKIHMKNILRNKRLNLVYIIDQDEEKANALKIEWSLDYTVVISTEESDLLFEDNTIGGVIVATACKDRKAWVLKALKAGKSVFCEAPLSPDIEGILRCYEVAKKVKIELFCGFNRRFHPTYAKMFSHLKTGKIEDIRLIKKTTVISSPLPHNDGDNEEESIMEAVTQEVDLLCWMVGKYPDRVIATAVPNRSQENHQDYESIIITMKFPDEIFGHIDISKSHVRKDDQTLEVIGKAEEIIAKNSSSCDIIHVCDTGFLCVPKERASPDIFKAAHREELQCFIDNIKGKMDVGISANNVIKVAKIVEALKASIEAEKYIPPQY